MRVINERKQTKEKSKSKSTNFLVYNLTDFREAGKLINNNLESIGYTNVLEKNKLMVYLLTNTEIVKKILKDSSLKSLISKTLDDLGLDYKKNLVDFPFLTDFLVDYKGQKVAINVKKYLFSTNF